MEHSLWALVVSVHHLVLEAELRLPGFGGKHLYLLSYLASPKEIQNLYCIKRRVCVYTVSINDVCWGTGVYLI